MGQIFTSLHFNSGNKLFKNNYGKRGMKRAFLQSQGKNKYLKKNQAVQILAPYN